MVRIGAPSLHTLLIISSFLLFSQIHARYLQSGKLERAPITVEGLSYDYYNESCPWVETIVKEYLEQLFADEIVIGPGILRLFFHDCFESGCDASMILHRQSEEILAPDNQGFRPYVLDTIEDLRAVIGVKCHRVVSCTDILTLAAREAVRLYGGPDFDVPLGRRDSLTHNIQNAANLPTFDQTTGEQLELYEKHNFDATELVALSGAHTVGVANCAALETRFKNGLPADPDTEKAIMDKCKNLTLHAPYVFLDHKTPYTFDNMIYVDILNNQAILNSDQTLAFDSRTKDIVESFASDEKLFFEKFAKAFVKLSQTNVLTGDEGEIRKSCFATNKEESSEDSEATVGFIKEI